MTGVTTAGDATNRDGGPGCGPGAPDSADGSACTNPSEEAARPSVDTVAGSCAGPDPAAQGPQDGKPIEVMGTRCQPLGLSNDLDDLDAAVMNP